ncbi:Hypothetical protein, putative [Bodo saltans]|uniref:Uncharacterized protein n=1 Tax=Bodo saltans TaxID=75058 RepID=A0A0S4JFN6_BODSA|nr:Hypothetical protein, putative [Bodo saltans]|eukprot:CUG87799.1 Hypothetical protein, putative [Bodo saltans]
MVKSTRSKWKKMHRRERAKDEAPQVAVRLQKLNVKLGLCANGGLSKVPIQDPETRFHFKQPERKAGERLVLSGMSTNPRGKSNPNAPHPATITFDTVEAVAPVAGMAITKEDQQRIESFHAAAADALNNPDYDNDEPVEFILGCNDDEDQTTVVGRGSLSSKKAAPLNSKKAISASATKLKSMEIQKGITKGDKKIKSSDAPTKRLVSGGKKK